MTATSIIGTLRQVGLFAGLEEHHLQELARHSRRRRFDANEALFHQGDPGHVLYIILSGRIRIQTLTPSGETVHIAFRGPGEHLGELALIDGKPRMADAVTAEPSDLLMLDQSDFIRCIAASPKVALAIMTSLAERLREAAKQKERDQGLDVLGRVSEALLDLMKRHGKEEPSGGVRINVSVPHRELAEQLGTTRESVTRAIAGLKAVGALRTEGRALIVLNAQKLSQYSAR